MCFAFSAQAATISAVSNERSAVQDAVDLAVDGDEVIVPAGTAYWTTRVTITNLITLRAAGIGLCIVYEENGTDDEGELIRADVSSKTNTTNWLRITGFDFRKGPTNTTSRFNGSVYVRGSRRETDNVKIRIDNNRFYRLQNRFVLAVGRGILVDHNVGEVTGQRGMLSFDDTSYGDNSWGTEIAYGTANEGLYVEDNIFTSVGGVNAFWDGWKGCRVVLRYNTLTNFFMGGHGTESSDRFRSMRWKAVYKNIFRNTLTGDSVVPSRGGTGVIFSNTIANPTSWNSLCRMVYYRSITTYRNSANPNNPWYGCFGEGPFDENDPTIYLSSTLTANSTTSPIAVTDSSQAWTPNQWRNYSFSSAARDRGFIILSNTATTLYYQANQLGSIYSFTNTEPYEIRKVVRGLDQPGAGIGLLLPSVYAVTNDGWTNQAVEPIYLWANTGKTNTSNAGYYYHIVNGRDYTNGVAHPTYAAYTYPHPLIAETEGALTAPSITEHPQSQLIPSGAMAVLNVSAVGSAPLSYQWFLGSSGVTTGLISGATSDVYVTPALTVQSNFWCLVSNSVGVAYSSTAVISVQATTLPPNIIGQPNSITINYGDIGVLAVVVEGTEPLAYQWYNGTSGTTTSPISAATNNIYVTGALTTSASYWARITNSAGTANSITATITVLPQSTNTATSTRSEKFNRRRNKK